MNRREILVGTCGFAESHQRSFRDFRILEIQQTFYQPPRLATAERWWKEAPADFVFTLKAWQLITHEASSPTYRRLKEPLSPHQLAQTGGFRWNPVTRMAWERTLEMARALRAEAVLFQTPRSFLPTPDNLKRMRRFFTAIERHRLQLIIEPRGEAWTSEILQPLIDELSLVHGVDPFLCRPLGNGLRYFRLHGRPAYHYGYRYTDADLLALRGMLDPERANWVLFNNAHMAEDARRFIRLLKKGAD